MKHRTTNKTVGQIAVFFEQSQLTGLPLIGTQQRVVNHISLDSRQLCEGDGFIALQGGSRHGLDYLQALLAKQPGLVISDRALNPLEQAIIARYNAGTKQLCTVLVVDHLAEKIADLAHWFYDQPSEHIKVVGITGTNGKTSTAFYTAQLLSGLKQKVALIGTLGNGIFGALQRTQNTTPDVVSIHRLLAQFIELDAQWVLMEVSSHALELGRIKQVLFETVALTQITRDHMDFHGTVEHYQTAKQKLFTDYRSKHQVLNLNDEIGQSLAKSAQLSGLFGYERSAQLEQMEGDMTQALPPAQLQCTELLLAPNGMRLSLKYQGERLIVKVPLLGAFNAENVLCACSIILSCESLNADMQTIKALLETLQSVEGRMQQVTQSPSVIVDFAHTPDALQQVLVAVKQHLLTGSETLGQKSTSVQEDQPSQISKPGKLWVVFGCGGDRDQGKRALMGDIAETIADKVMVTDDNPRFENPQQIRQQIFNGFKQPQSALQQADRKLAIEAVLASAKPEDIVVIAGKGHE
ncbi:MAG: UDP-N-acetylmuramoyl-L-alanyl-D-glutamate--2,6-diaminopimelate ligase, partial [Pseudomonadota bacterium]